jgi:hypothetical protein
MWQTIVGIIAMAVAGQAAVAAGDAAAAKPAEPTEFRITLDLSEGSHVIGAAATDGLDVVTAYGTAHLKWSDIRSIDWSEGDRTGRFNMQNGDNVSGRAAQEKIGLTTLVGPVTIPMAYVRRLSVDSPAAPARAAFGLKFDGKQNFVTVRDDVALDPTGAMTLECWFKTSVASSFSILGKRRVTDNGDHGYQLHITFGNLHGYWEGHFLPGRGALNDGQWHHAALTWDGQTRRLYQDGVKVAEDMPGPWKPYVGALRIGAIEGDHAPDFYQGLISQVRLSKVDRYKNRNFTPALRLEADAGTVACWDFSEGAGAILHDSSGQGHNGTLTGDPPPEWVKDAPGEAGVASRPDEVERMIAQDLNDVTAFEKAESFDDAIGLLQKIMAKYDRKYWPGNIEDRIRMNQTRKTFNFP